MRASLLAPGRAQLATLPAPLAGRFSRQTVSWRQRQHQCLPHLISGIIAVNANVGDRRMEDRMAEIPSWHIAGDWFDNCSCAVACPCTFAQAPDNGFCESVLFWHIRQGHYGDIS